MVLDRDAGGGDLNTCMYVYVNGIQSCMHRCLLPVVMTQHNLCQCKGPMRPSGGVWVPGAVSASTYQQLKASLKPSSKMNIAMTLLAL
jgi:hypothetical protein